MTAPTQAQIEAAAKAIKEFQVPQGYIFLGDNETTAQQVATAALTAAAEAEEKETTMEHIARDIKEGRFPNMSKARQVKRINKYEPAAAEVDPVQDAEPQTSGKSPSCAQSGRTVGANPATGATAAEVGEPEYLYDKERRTLTKYQQAVNATIERCARVAEHMRMQEHISANYNAACNTIAAAIRALKERPCE